MPIHTTNYFNTFIEIAEDSPHKEGEIPPLKGEKQSIANLQFDMIVKNPYKYTSDEVLFAIHAIRKGFHAGEMDEQREHFFSKGQACFRASPLTKRYGWGVHCNKEGKIAIYAAGSSEYLELLADDTIVKVKAMRSSRK